MSNKLRSSVIAKHLSLLMYALIIIVPLSLVFFATFKKTSELYNNPLGAPASWALDNYLKLFQSENMLIYFGNSVIVTAFSVFFIILFGSMLAYAILRLPTSMGNVLFGFLTIGMMVPVQVNMIPT